METAYFSGSRGTQTSSRVMPDLESLPMGHDVGRRLWRHCKAGQRLAL